MRPSRHPWLKLAALVAVVGAAVGVLHFLGIRWSDIRPDQVRAFVLSFGWWSWLMYFLIYAQPLVPLPATVMLMVGGLAFGLIGGLALAFATVVVRGCGQFLLARSCGREAVETLLRGRLAAWDERIGRHDFWAVLWIRLVPNVPYDLQNFGLGLSRVSFKSFTLATLLGLVPAVVLWVYLGHTLTDARALWKVILGLLAIAALAAVARRSRARPVRRSTS